MRVKATARVGWVGAKEASVRAVGKQAGGVVVVRGGSASVRRSEERCSAEKDTPLTYSRLPTQRNLRRTRQW